MHPMMTPFVILGAENDSQVNISFPVDIGIVWARNIDWLFCIGIVLLKFPLLIIELELYCSQKSCIGQPGNSQLGYFYLGLCF
jgi:hypothetical protein